MRFSREEYLDLLAFGGERQMFVELFGALVGLDGEWRAQGATEAELDLTAFDWDYVERVHVPGHTGLMGGLEPIVLSETAEHIIGRDEYGRTTKLCKGRATIPLPLDYPVCDMDSWLKLKPMFVFDNSRVPPGLTAAAMAKRAEGCLVVAGMPGGFDTPRELMGEQVACLAYYDQPELMHDIVDTLSDMAFRTLELARRELPLDVLTVHEDLAGKSGPLIGPSQVAEYVKPYYRKVWDMLQERGARVFQQDSDGNMSPVIDAFIEAGVTTFYPMEPAAGMDVVQARVKYGHGASFMGGIDKHVLRGTQDETRRELEYKMQPMMQAGGMVFGLDHRIPNGTPLANYKYYVSVGRELLGLPPIAAGASGWQRMAF